MEPSHYQGWSKGSDKYNVNYRSLNDRETLIIIRTRARGEQLTPMTQSQQKAFSFRVIVLCMTPSFLSLSLSIHFFTRKSLLSQEGVYNTWLYHCIYVDFLVIRSFSHFRSSFVCHRLHCSWVFFRENRDSLQVIWLELGNNHIRIWKSNLFLFVVRKT